MPKVIDHDKRKTEILVTALEVFAKEGFKDTNMSLIANSCNISRTTIYQYFKDKNEIFHYAIKSTTDKIFQHYTSEEFSEIQNPMDKLVRITNDILDRADNYKTEIIQLLQAIKDIDINFDEALRHRTAKLNLLVARTIREAVQKGLACKCSPQEKADKLIALLESYCLNLAFMPGNCQTVRALIADYLNSLLQ